MKNNLSVRYAQTVDLIPYARNSRTHSDEQVAQIAASIKEFGFTNPILVDADNGIVAGHGRVLAAQKLKLEQVPVIELTGLTDAQRRAYVIADNKLAMNAGWDAEMLAVELDDLRDQQFDMSLLGFTPEELNDLIGTPNLGPNLDESPIPQYSIIIDCGSQEKQDDLMSSLERDGHKCRVWS